MAVSRVLLVALTVLVSTCLGGNPKTDLHDQLDSADLTDVSSATALFQAWKQAHQITFDNPAKESKALETFVANARKIKQHRAEYAQGLHTYQTGINKFTHVPGDEFRSSLGFISKKARSNPNLRTNSNRPKRAAAPASLNYTAQGMVSAVKDQGECGCCWTFSTTGALEGAYFKKYGKLMSFSEQMLVECFQTYAGCDGGVVADAVDYVNTLGGIATEAGYPYTSQNGNYGSCKLPSIPLTPMAPLYADVNEDDTSLMNALVQGGIPVSVSVGVGDPFQNYISGVMDPSSACVSEINHAVLLVGYGVDAATGLPYWLVKNSWSSSWGENGYFRLRRDISDSCGINEEAEAVSM
jgi:C1A family cysteine protease